MISAFILKDVNGFDQRLFMYIEDVDLCRRIGMVIRLPKSRNSS